jgi:hypothetical protein
VKKIPIPLRPPEKSSVAMRTERNSEDIASAGWLAIAPQRRLSSIAGPNLRPFYEEKQAKRANKSTLYNPHQCCCQRKYGHLQKDLRQDLSAWIATLPATV